MPGELRPPSAKNEPQVVERLHKMVHRWPSISGYHLNPDAKTVEGIVGGLTRSVLKYGYPFCPCRDLTGNHEIDKSNICPCKFHHQEIATDGYCKCVLFVGDNFDPEVAYAPHGASEQVTQSRSIRQRDVQVYTTDWCSHSRRTRRLLEQLGIPYTNHNVEQDESAAALVEKWNRGYRSVPTLQVSLIITEPSTVELDNLLIGSEAHLLESQLYITNWCSHSRRVTNWFREQGLPSTIIDIEQDASAATRVESWNKGFQSVPTLNLSLVLTEPSTEQLELALGLHSA